MAVADLAATIAGARFVETFKQMNVWDGLLGNYSDQIGMYAEYLDIPTDDTSYEPGDSPTIAQTRGTTAADIAWPTPTVVTGSKVQLRLDQLKTINRLIPYIGNVLTRPDFIESASRNAAREFREAFNGQLRGTMLAAAAGNQIAAMTIANQAAYGNAAHKTAVKTAFRTAQKTANGRHWPKDMGMRYCVLGPDMYGLVNDILEEDKLFLVRGGNEQLVMNGDVINYRGWDIMLDDSIPLGTANGTEDNHTMYWGVRGYGGVYAMRLQDLQVIRSEVYQGQLLQGVALWGSLISEPTKSMITKLTITS